MQHIVDSFVCHSVSPSRKNPCLRTQRYTAEYFIAEPTVNAAIPINIGSAMCRTHIANF